MNDTILQGTCLCGQIGFQIDQALEDASFCHCSICRKNSGSAFAAYGASAIENFKWLQGEDLLRQFNVTDVLTKQFCSCCGSTLITHHSAEPDLYHVSLGCLADDAEVKPLYHQFIDSKANWYSPTDGLPQFQQWPGED